jgi:hypothetical protein
MRVHREVVTRYVEGRMELRDVGMGNLGFALPRIETSPTRVTQIWMNGKLN